MAGAFTDTNSPNTPLLIAGVRATGAALELPAGSAPWTLLLVVFSIGIGIGSLLCEVLSKRHVEIGLVPLGAIGMSVFSIDLYFAARGLPLYASRDWHPADHCSFRARGGAWPAHCVAGSAGAAFAEGLRLPARW